MLLEGKTALITATSRGIGRAIAEEFAHEGCNIWAHARTCGEAQERWAADLAKSCGVTVRTVYFDMRDFEAIEQGFEKLRAEETKLDILVNVAGIMLDPIPFVDTPMERIMEVFQVNFFSHLRCAQLALPMMPRNAGASIVNIASTAGLDRSAGEVEYGTSKAAAISFTRKLATELGPEGIRVNAVCPGVVATDMGDSIPDDIFAEMVSNSAIRRKGTTTEIARMAAFLASDRIPYLTGQAVQVDGGMV